MRARRDVSEQLRLIVATVLIAGCLMPGIAGAATLFDRIGIGADWGPHWATGPSAASGDPRDTQADGAFPAEVCLLRNAGFKTIRMYDADVATWLALLDAVDDYNTGTLNCNPAGGPAQPCTGDSCMSVVYQVGICGPDPRSLLWNGSFAQIDYVKCYEVGQPVGKERPFKDSVDEELLKLRQVIANGGAKFAANVSLVLVGNEIFFSRGVCSNGGAACTDSRDCGSGTCNIGHYCSNQLTGNSPSPTCASSATCSSGASCTDVANVSALKYAFDRVQPVLAQLGGTPPPISISLQMDLLVSPSFGDDPKTAPLMFSRQQLGQALPDKIIATNTYPDQWGNVTVNQLPTTCSGGSFASCVGPQNAVLGQALLAGCVDDPRYRDPVTGKIAHTIDNYFTRLRSYYPGFDLVIAETGWHTSGTCVAYNDCASTYSAGDAATYYQDLYAYVQTNKIPLLAFQPFDQRTKLCDPAGRPPTAVAEANYGIFTNFCQLKGGNQALLPPAGPGSPGPNLAAFTALLDDDSILGAKSCRPQTLVGVIGVGSAGICEHNTNIACNGGYDPAHPAPGLDKCPPGPGAQANRCVWGYCANDTTIGCNPDDPDNVTGCGVCKRAGNCYGADPPGLFAANVNCGAGPRSCVAACRNAQGCNGALAPFTDSGKCGEPGHECACFVAMAPSTLQGSDDNKAQEAPGFTLKYSKGDFQFTKTRTLLPEVVLHPNGFEVSPVWGNAFLGQGWTLEVVNPPDTTVSAPGPCPVNTVSALNVSNPLQPVLSWSGNWAACSYQVGGVIANPATRIVFPRGYLDFIPSWPPPVFCFAGTARSASRCGGGEPITVTFKDASGTTQGLGLTNDSGSLRISGQFNAPAPLRLDLASVTVDGLLDEVEGVGELSQGPGGAALLPITLGARDGSTPHKAKYETAAGVRPSVSVQVESQDASTGLMTFTIAVDGDSMPVRPSRCKGWPSLTWVRTSFTLDDGSGEPLVVEATLPWHCRGKELQIP